MNQLDQVDSVDHFRESAGVLIPVPGLALGPRGSVHNKTLESEPMNNTPDWESDPSILALVGPRRPKPIQVLDDCRRVMTEAEALAFMNSRHAVYWDDGRVVVVTFKKDGTPYADAKGRPTHSTGLATFYANRCVEIEDGNHVDLHRWWKRHPNRRECSDPVRRWLG